MENDVETRLSTKQPLISIFSDPHAQPQQSPGGAWRLDRAAFESAANWQNIRQAHLDAFRYALPCAYDKRVVAAIHAAWDSMEAGQP